jgi:hypothetical protein
LPERNGDPDSGFPGHDGEIRGMAPIIARHLPALPGSGRAPYFQP